MYDQSYVFEDINYVNKDTSKKDSTLLEIMTLLKSLDGPFNSVFCNYYTHLFTLFPYARQI